MTDEEITPAEVRALARLSVSSPKISEIPLADREPFRWLVLRGMAQIIPTPPRWTITVRGRRYLTERIPTP